MPIIHFVAVDGGRSDWSASNWFAGGRLTPLRKGCTVAGANGYGCEANGVYVTGAPRRRADCHPPLRKGCCIAGANGMLQGRYVLGRRTAWAGGPQRVLAFVAVGGAGRRVNLLHPAIHITYPGFGPIFGRSGAAGCRPYERVVMVAGANGCGCEANGLYVSGAPRRRADCHPPLRKGCCIAGANGMLQGRCVLGRRTAWAGGPQH